MKKRYCFWRKMIAIFNIVVLMCVNSNIAYADEMTPEEYELAKLEAAGKCLRGEAHDHNLCQSEQQNPYQGSYVMPLTTVCKYCGGDSNDYCNQDAIEYARGTHSYNLWTATCTVVYLKSSMYTLCYDCGMKYYLWYNEDGSTSGGLAYHDCWEVHLNCGKGNYDVCPLVFS